MHEKIVNSKILEARSVPQKSRYLQPIHEASFDVLSKEREIAGAERELVTVCDALYSGEDKPTTVVPAQQQLHDKVRTP